MDPNCKSRVLPGQIPHVGNADVTQTTSFLQEMIYHAVRPLRSVQHAGKVYFDS